MKDEKFVPAGHPVTVIGEQILAALSKCETTRDALTIAVNVLAMVAAEAEVPYGELETNLRTTYNVNVASKAAFHARLQ